MWPVSGRTQQLQERGQQRLAITVCVLDVMPLHNKSNLPFLGVVHSSCILLGWFALILEGWKIAFKV